MKGRQARKIINNILRGKNIVGKPYNLETIGKACRKTAKQRIEACKKWNAEHPDCGYILSPIVNITYVSKANRVLLESMVNLKVNQRYYGEM